MSSDATGTGFQDYNWVSGRATSVLIDPADATGNTVLVGGAYGGLWRSTNAGSLSPDPSVVTWQPLLDDQPTLAVGAIAVQPGSGQAGISQVILAGTGETNSSNDSYYGLGILRSTDGGGTWTQVVSDVTGNYSFLGVGFSKIVFSTSNPNLVVAATAGDNGLELGLEQDEASTARGLYWSNDAGQSWRRVTLSDSAVPASGSGIVFDAGQGTNGTFYAAIRRHGIYSSSDGQHFARLAIQPSSGLASANCPAEQNSQTCLIYRAELAVVAGRNEMYAWIVDYQSGPADQGVWKTMNGGSSWTQIPDTGITNCGDPGRYGCGVQQGTYNLELAAVPDGSGTDVYAGAINIYKCTLVGGTTCTQGNWINLTHAYGCDPIAAPAHVHPDQHGLDFMVSGATSPGYFAHDGGISRTLDGYGGLNSGSCSGTNQFDSLSQTLGSMAELVSFSVHPTNADIMLGGTQDNGSPKTASATASTVWQNSLSGDGGYNAINPANPNEWFTSNPDDSSFGFEIYKCESGTSCNESSFVPVIDTGTLGGDHGAFYTPYILDPQNAGAMLVGTCRMWRVSASGSAPLQLSNDFEDGGTGICTGDEINLVAAIDAGGAMDPNGNSKVVYATTYGFGPLSGSPGGRVWLTSDAGAAMMSDVTGPINPDGYEISSVAMDRSDATGQTAFVGIRGFHVSQVWLTRNGGTNWTDWTIGAGMPDVPVNSLLVDSQMGIVYAGTDVGVFASSTMSPGWTELEPDPGSRTGFLPNAPVTAMRLFSPNQNVRKLRVATYGRGIWEYDLDTTPDFINSIANSPQTVFPSQSATYNGTLTAVNHYNSLVDLSCTGTVPSTCSMTPTQALPTASGTAYSVKAGGAVGDYTFNAHAVGNDSSHRTHDAPITLRVVDFALTSPTPGTVNVPEGYSATTQFQVTAAGSFSQSVTLSCDGLPANASCAFSPSAVVNPTSGNPANITLTVSATASTPTGTSTIAVQGVTTGPTATRTATFQLVVQPAPDFSFVSSGSTTHSVLAGQNTLAYSFVVTPSSGSTFFADVTFSCAFVPSDPTLGESSCTFNPVKISAGSGATNVSLTITTAGPNTGTGSNGPETRRQPRERRVGWLWYLSVPLMGVAFVAVIRDKRRCKSVLVAFTVCLSIAGVLIACGGGGGTAEPNPGPPPSQISVTVSPSSASIPLGGTRQFSAIVQNSGNSGVTWSLSGSGASGSSIDNSGLLTVPDSAVTPLNFSVVATAEIDTTKSGTSAVTIPAVTVAIQPASTVAIYANEAGNSWPESETEQQFTASVGNSAVDRAVTWSLPSGNSSGSIDSAGMYRAPATVPNPSSFAVTATAHADSTKSNSDTIQILQPTAIGSFTLTVTAAEGDTSHSRPVTLTVE